MFMFFHIVHVLFIVKGNYIIFANNSANKGSFECLNYVCNDLFGISLPIIKI